MTAMDMVLLLATDPDREQQRQELANAVRDCKVCQNVKRLCHLHHERALQLGMIPP